MPNNQLIEKYKLKSKEKKIVSPMKIFDDKTLKAISQDYVYIYNHVIYDNNNNGTRTFDKKMDRARKEYHHYDKEHLKADVRDPS